MRGNERGTIACAKRFFAHSTVALAHCGHRVAEAKKYTADMFFAKYRLSATARNGGKTPLKKKPLVVSAGLSALLDSYTRHRRDRISN